MPQRSHFTGLITILILALLLPSQAAVAQEGKALVRTEPAVLEVGKGQIETLQILLVNAQNVYGIDLQAAFDPAVVEVVDADPEQSGVQMTPEPFLKPDFVVLNICNNETGSLRYVVTQLNPTPPANGEGAILSIQFLGKAIGIRTALTILSVQIADRRGVKLPVNAQGADLAAVSPKPPTPILAPTATLALTTLTIPSPTVNLLQPTSRPSATAGPNDLASNVEDVDFTTSSKILTYVTATGFFGSALLISLSAWFLTPKRRSGRTK